MIHYKFKGTKTWNCISSDDGFLSVLDLKREIIKHKMLNKGNANFNLVITDAQSGADYTQDGFLIPRNAAVVVRRVPTRTQHAPLASLNKATTIENQPQVINHQNVHKQTKLQRLVS